MANRRKFIAGLGALATGSAAAMGTGAFTNVEAERDVTVNVADDASAFLSLSVIPDSANSQEYADASGDAMALDFSSTNSGGSGFNTDATTEIDDVFQVRNQGTQTIYFSISIPEDEFVGNNEFDNNSLYFYPNGASDTPLNSDNELGLPPGESASIGLFADSDGVLSFNSAETLTATVVATDEATGTKVDRSGDDLVNEFETDDDFASITVERGATTTFTTDIDTSVQPVDGSDWPDDGFGAQDDGEFESGAGFFAEITFDYGNNDSPNDDFRFASQLNQPVGDGGLDDYAGPFVKANDGSGDRVVSPAGDVDGLDINLAEDGSEFVVTVNWDVLDVPEFEGGVGNQPGDPDAASFNLFIGYGGGFEEYGPFTY